MPGNNKTVRLPLITESSAKKNYQTFATNAKEMTEKKQQPYGETVEKTAACCCASPCLCFVLPCVSDLKDPKDFQKRYEDGYRAAALVTRRGIFCCDQVFFCGPGTTRKEDLLKPATPLWDNAATGIEGPEQNTMK